MGNKAKFFKRKNSLNCRGKLFDLSTPKVMGILNITPDSFFDGGKYSTVSDAVKHTETMLAEGADIIDIGAISSRPGASLMTAEEELKRLKPVLKEINKNFPDIIISVDTFRSDVAKIMIEDYGVSIINDISAGNLDANMSKTVAELRAPYIIMHMLGTPATMQKDPQYKDVIFELIQYFQKKIHALVQDGVLDIIIDPGFGFGKTVEHNFKILKELSSFQIFELPILAGVSRKSMINKTLDCKPENSLNGTTSVNTIALMNGANILRVHDVKEAVETVKIFNALNAGSK